MKNTSRVVLLPAILGLVSCDGGVSPEPGPSAPNLQAVGMATGRHADVADLPNALPGLRSEFSISSGNGVVTVTRLGSGVPPLVRANPRLIRFYDRHVVFGEDTPAADVYRLYRAAFKRTPDEAGLGFWIDAANAGMPIATIAAQFGSSKEFQDLYGSNPTPQTIVELLYNNVLGRSADKAGMDYWVDAIGKGYTLQQLLVFFAASAENKDAVRPEIAQGISYVPVGEESSQGMNFTYEWYLSANKEYAWDRVSAPAHPVRYGTQSERFELRTGDCGGSDCQRADGNRERSEFATVGVQNYEGDVYWYGWSFYVPANHVDSGNLAGTFQSLTIAQFAQHPAPPNTNYYLSLMFSKLYQGDVVMRTFPTDPGNTRPKHIFTVIPQAEFAGRWHDMLVEAKWTEGANGYARVWHNGVLKVDYAGPTRSAQTQDVYFKYGLYRPMTPLQPVTTVLYFDEIRRGKRREDVDIRLIEQQR